MMLDLSATATWLSAALIGTTRFRSGNNGAEVNVSRSVRSEQSQTGANVASLMFTACFGFRRQRCTSAGEFETAHLITLHFQSDWEVEYKDSHRKYCTAIYFEPKVSYKATRRLSRKLPIAPILPLAVFSPCSPCMPE
jgi:hypothetical protein